MDSEVPSNSELKRALSGGFAVTWNLEYRYHSRLDTTLKDGSDRVRDTEKGEAREVKQRDRALMIEVG